MPDGDRDLGALTGLRSGKRSYYPEYVRSAERLERAVQALDGISRALVRGVEGPRALVEAVVRAAAEHLQARWLLLAVADGALRAARPRFLVLVDDVLIDDVARLPAEVRPALELVRQRPWELQAGSSRQGRVRAPMMLDGEPVGGIVGSPRVEVASTDLAIVRVLANQAAVALHNSYLFQAATQLRGRTEQLSEAAAKQARDLAARNAELAETQQRLLAALQRQALDDERHRIARELHDSVTQYVLSAGMTLEVCRAELAASGETALAGRLAHAKDLTRQAVERLRGAIYALHHTSGEPSGPLPVLLAELSTVHLPSELSVRVKVVGQVLTLPGETERSLLRIAGEALFNAAAHAKASLAVVRLVYQPSRVALTVSDNGSGDPAELRRLLRLASAADLDGRHRGLANMLARTEELGGTMTIRRARLGGIALRVVIPVPEGTP
ncbi:sensor histidine kinase [Amycolatopsis rhizosphaerae]|uniref:Sensor histidine kinase n=1 Tax=Amycolatopsis rhizosphaerae TaxID=2053003 RepID=A0A558DJL2_9PSEU|nr:histidine kinase [Amycolatopsis rhizosphaerae]TVT61199.1 sensor histidine kinase [Amycolatopsis rhizosphaerae]